MEQECPAAWIEVTTICAHPEQPRPPALTLLSLGRAGWMSVPLVSPWNKPPPDSACMRMQFAQSGCPGSPRAILAAFRLLYRDLRA